MPTCSACAQHFLCGLHIALDKLVRAHLLGGPDRSLLAVWRYDPAVDIENDGARDDLIVWYGSGVSDLDETKTMAVFGHPLGESDPRLRLRMIGPQIGIFEYQGVFYFDTVFDARGDFTGHRVGDPELLNTLGVFLRKNGETHQVCEYVFSDRK
jgi:hypothetical protein